MSLLIDCLTGGERDHALRWLEAFSNGSDRETIVGANWGGERNLCTRIGAAIGHELYSAWNDGDSPMAVIPTITPAESFCADENIIGNPGSLLSRVMNLRSLAKFHLNRTLPLTKDLSDADMLALISDLDPAVDLTGNLRGSYDFCWATRTDQIEGIVGADNLRDIVGTPFRLYPNMSADVRAEMESLIEVTYSDATAPSLHRPTVIEAQGSAEFRPSDENSQHGVTVNLSTGAAGVHEYVHPSFPANRVAPPIRSRGRITTDPPDGWIVARLASL